MPHMEQLLSDVGSATRRVGQNRIHTLYVIVYLVVFLPKIPYTSMVPAYPSYGRLYSPHGEAAV
jgi:hypothetical protein